MISISASFIDNKLCAACIFLGIKKKNLKIWTYEFSQITIPIRF